MQQEIIAKNWRQLIRPRRLEMEEESGTANYGRFWCEPLERGFGTTLGNSLRRVLLSSLQGAAITSVKVNGVLHEFSTIPGVLEDVSDIVLNLKDVRLRMHSEGPKVLRFHKKGAGEIVAGDLVADDSSVEILTPELHLATLSEEADVEMEVTVGTGKGYADRHRSHRLDLLAGASGQLHRDAGARGA
jgi:DNA-directed RNA polymerase subunit alpha